MSMIDRTNGSRVGYSGTSIPNQAIEYKSYGSGTVREYTLTPEELEEVRQKYPATKRDKAFKKPVAHNPREDRFPPKQQSQNTEEEQNMTGQRMSKEGPSSGLTKQIFLEQIASGETVASVEKAWGMKYNTLSFWVKKWDLRGINAVKAQELLAGESPRETQLLREKEALPPVGHQAGEVERLKAEVEHWKVQAAGWKKEKDAACEWGEEQRKKAVEAVALAGKAAEESMAKIERLTAARDGAIAAREAAELDLEQTETRCSQYAQSIDQLATECDGLQEEVNRLITERDDLVAEVEDLRDDIRRLREIQTLAAAPASDVHLLDRSIADLTRAKWILNRLTASGE
ncbi:hypothetical protein [Paenibacillus riograndensis]|uniref:Uncharacterized protein n=1 Tax=Paenibacillus riograndensis SBR5 TaxID=1073571 RepID=A0A0E4CU26_9BACL|nr:hypothetical protein [Paenibacillus riograndensis]CQR51458.1 hypothetical protein PRIO_0212 [Paenibacillus riograndensis SBR5]